MRESSISKRRQMIIKKRLYVDDDGYYVCGGECGKKVCKPSKHGHDLRTLGRLHGQCFDENVEPFFKLK